LTPRTHKQRLMSDVQFRQIVKTYYGEQKFWDALIGFLYAIDWTEGWIIGLLCLQGFLLLFVVATRKIIQIQIPTFFLVLFAIYMSERINRWANEHWQQFAGQNYFDEHGVFIALVYAGPLLLISFVILVNFLIINAKLLIAVKRAELRSKQKKEQINKKTQ
jgi:hypothetical protein